MTFRSYRSSPLLKFQKRVRFNKTVQRYTRKTFSPSIQINPFLIKTMTLHVLPSEQITQILQMAHLTLGDIITMEFNQEQHQSHLSLEQIATQQLESIADMKVKLKELKSTSKPQESEVLCD